MPNNLLHHVTGKAGNWFAKNLTAAEIRMSDSQDEVTLTGPLTVNVSLVAENVTQPLDGGHLLRHSRELYSYDLAIPAGHRWTYRMAESVLPPAVSSNRGWSVVIRPTLPAPNLVQSPHDIPCDYAVADIRDTASFFPASCEGCPPGAVIGTPTSCSPILNVPVSAGGCVRPRFFNGMFMTREDMETQLRYFRLKMRLHNRAAGQGVVWGLAVSRHGGKIRVQPGYAVDCCGNDLTVTCPYDVNVSTLLADPIACPLLTGGSQRMHLLLEYIECPEEPRPVHGDPCSPQTTLCEMSRIRETVRLRLVPPRDYQPDGPIGRFLDRLTKDPAFALASGVLPDVPTAAVVGAATVPFSVIVRNSSGAPAPLELQPISGGEVVGQLSQRENPNGGVVLTIAATGGFSFRAGQVTRTMDDDRPVEPPQVAATEAPPFSTLPWKTNVPQLGAPGPRQEFAFSNWVAASDAGDESQLSASTTITLRFLRVGGEDSLRLEVRVMTTAVEGSRPEPAPWPCFTEACDPQGKPRFSVLPPWSHPDPLGTAIPADPKVLALAVLYGLFTLTANRFENDDAASASRVVEQLSRIHRAAWLVLFRRAPDTEQRRLTVLLRDLLAEWCHGLLYPGPQCRGEPHGVVIGCVQVKAGDICCVDSWGGRRWVVHYPLLAYWGEQFGIAPPDLLASQLFDFICCLAHLRLPPAPVRPRDMPATSTTHLNTSVFPLGSSYLMFGNREHVLVRARELGLQEVRMQNIDLFDFIGRVAAASRANQPSGSPYVLFAPAGFSNVYFAAPQSTSPGERT